MISNLIRQLFDSSQRDMDTHYDIVTLATVASTQDEARNRVANTGISSLVIAREQFRGRGRQGREWSQPDLGMFASLGFVSDWDQADRTLVPLVAAVSMRRAIERMIGVEVMLKWPNDLMTDGLKIGGILVETSGDTIIVGCGLNLMWNEPIAGAAALLTDADASVDARTLADTWAGVLLTLMDAGASAWPRAEYEDASVTLGEDVHWDGGAGRAVGIAESGALVVDRLDELIELHSGEVHTHRGG